MRRYEITITDQDGNPKIIKGKGGVHIFNGTFTSTDDLGRNIPGALNIELDVPVSVCNSPLGGASLRVYGVGLPLISQAADFNPSIDRKTYCNIEIKCGMSKGLPLSNPQQYGTILRSRIEQAFGNWQGTSQEIDFIMVQPTGTIENPLNFSFNCPNNGFLGDAIKDTLKNVFKTSEIKINISDRLIAPEDIVASYSTLDQFSEYINDRSRSIFNDANYKGIQIAFLDNVISVYDFTQQPKESPLQINFQDLIGQPTWISPYTLAFSTPMRYDIRVASQVIMPSETVQGENRGLILTTPYSQSQYKETVNFTGVFNVVMVRHMGIFRQGTANSWVTVFHVATAKP